ncbi:MAG: DUF58 domain-containing protein [Treponema sp.]|nr:DUF58 domain-containing protein [Treponema sp.]
MKSAKNINSASIGNKTVTIVSWILAVLTLAVGLATQEIILTLAGFISIFLLIRLFVNIAILMNFYKKKAGFFSCTIHPPEAAAGESLCFELWIQNLRHIFPFTFPGILTTYEVHLVTKDQKNISVSIPIPQRKQVSAPDSASPVSLLSVTVDTTEFSRGVYYTKGDNLVIADMFGFHTQAIGLQHTLTERVIIGPKPMENGLPFRFQIGGSSRREELVYQKTEDLTEHRPYTPGDDPRRINWKLFGHSGDLFVRQEELEPPPVSEYTLVLDTSVDHRLFSEDEGRKLVDVLCRHALTLALELIHTHFSINLWFPGSELKCPEETAIAKTLAYPYTVDMRDSFSIPDFSRETSLFILALPRTIPSPNSVLEKILNTAPNPRQIYFINPAIVLASQLSQESYENCVRYYGNHHAT